MKKVLVDIKVKEHTKKELKSIRGYEFFFRDEIDNYEEVLRDCEILIGSPDRETVRKAVNLQWIQLPSAGAEGYGWLDEKILLTNAYGAYGRGISEFMLAEVLMFMKKLPQYLSQQQEHYWKALDGLTKMEDSVVVSVGMGSIGTRFLELAHALGAHCFGVRRTVHDKPAFVEGLCTPTEMKEILGKADVVALSMPHTPETKGMFNREVLSWIKPGAILLNVGRGSAIVTADLVELVRQGHFGAVMLDVTDPEPLPEDHPLWDLENVFITPHTSGRYSSDVNYQHVIDVIIENLVRAQAGKPVLHAVDRNRGY